MWSISINLKNEYRPTHTEDESNSTTLPRPEGCQRMMHTSHERSLVMLHTIVVFLHLNLRRSAYEMDGEDPN